MSIRVPHVMRAQASHDYGEPLPKIVSAERPGGRLQRRRVLVGLGGASTILSVGLAPPADAFTESEWNQLVKDGKLSRAAYSVLHDSSTERPFTSPLNDEKRVGVFECAACGTPLFDSKTKFNSGTGWPSFYAKTDNVELEQTNIMDKVVLQRKEVHCKTCKGHLGHVFEDGWVYPETPTNQRYCINGVSLQFIPDADQPEVAKQTSKMTEFGRVPVQG
eukprot:CAMPEP_0114252968 /NCGR_PEP_ID=MMETSP0058-20121206/16133_1 /TAXON_ID=36894 /ORGANISM="Pyramimonas parkeae, CCMP726" /LENGTH=218 /DNA_ID=CAMNT_0001366965 /DNA_START=84 /DNA_END=740 /DNA_ORIENTATION=+